MKRPIWKGNNNTRNWGLANFHGYEKHLLSLQIHVLGVFIYMNFVDFLMVNIHPRDMHPSWVYIGMTPLQVLHLRPGAYPQPDSISSRVHSPSPSSRIWKSAAPENFTDCFCVSLRSLRWWVETSPLKIGRNRKRIVSFNLVSGRDHISI